MCTLAFAFQTHRWPLVVAANRDERIGRPAEGWAIRESGGTCFAAPRDLAAGGTWIGVSAQGVFSALTNHHTGVRDPERRSRGELAVRALAQGSALGAREDLERLDAAAYNPFHLVVADARHAFLLRYDGTVRRLEELEPGLHVVTESEHEAVSARGVRVRALWPREPDVAALRDVLAWHATPPRDGTCIHLDPAYGTRSAAILRLAERLEDSELHVADGRPCTTPFEDRSPLLVELRRAP